MIDVLFEYVLFSFHELVIRFKSRRIAGYGECRPRRNSAFSRAASCLLGTMNTSAFVAEGLNLRFHSCVRKVSTHCQPAAIPEMALPNNGKNQGVLPYFAVPRRSPSPAHPSVGSDGFQGGSRGGSSGRGKGWSGDGHGKGYFDGNPDAEGEGLDARMLAILNAARRTVDSLPADIHAALTSGQANHELLERVLQIESLPILGALIRRWPALRNRLIANSRFPLQMGVELTVGVVTKTLAELSLRGERFWKEFDFYMSDLSLEIVGDAMLVWLLSPTAMFSTRAKSGYIRPFLQGLPKHAFQTGEFSLVQRGSSFLYKGAQFAIVGFLSSVVGHGLTTALVNRRKAREAASGGKRRISDSSDVVLAPVLPTSVTWGGFMFCSSNPRYQAVNGLEQRVLYPLLEGKHFLSAVVTFALRFSNCFVGGVHWIPFARFFGIQ